MTLRELSSNWGGGTSNFQGGAIYANGYSGAVAIAISDTTFNSNTASEVSELI